IGTTQLRSVPMAEYAKTTSAVENPKNIKIQATNETGEEDALFEVKDKDGNVVFAVYNDGVRVYVDDTDPNGGGKAAKSGFAVAGRSGKAGEGNTYFAVNDQGTQVYVDDDPTDPGKAAKAKFAVAGKSGKGDDNYLVINKAGTQIFVDDEDSKAAKAKFAVAGKSGKTDDNLLVVNQSGTKVYVDDDPTDPGKAAKAKFAVAGKSGKDDDNYLVVNKAGTQVFVDEADGKAAKAKFAVAGKSGKSDGSIGDNYLVINDEGTKVFVDGVNGQKAAKAKFAVASVRNGKSETAEDFFLINKDGTQVFIDEDTHNNKAAKAKFAVASVKSGKDGDDKASVNPNYLVIDSDSTRVYIDNTDNGKAAKSGFAVAGKSGGKGNNADILKVTGDSTRVYVNGGSSKSGFGVEGKAGAGSKSGFAVSEKGANGNANYMNVTAANFFAGYNAGKNINLHYDQGGDIPDNIFDEETDPDAHEWFDNLLMGANNTFIGNNAGYSSKDGINNVLIGVNSGYSLTGVLSYNNVFLGTNAGKNLKNMQGSVAIGNNAGRGLESYQPEEYSWISSDVFIGNNAGYSNTSGSSNVFVGANAGRNNTTGGSNVYIGNGAGKNNTTSWGNTLINNSGLKGTGNENIIIGGVSWGTDLTFGSNNIIIGLDAIWSTYYDNGADNRLVIGRWITGDLSKVTVWPMLYARNGITLYSGCIKPGVDGYLDLGTIDKRWDTLYVRNIDLSNKISINNMSISGKVGSNILPSTGVQYNLGEEGYRWNSIYADNADIRTYDKSNAILGVAYSSGATDVYGVKGYAYYGTNNYGVYGYSSNKNATKNYGVYGKATYGTTAYGVYGEATGGTENSWAGYFKGRTCITSTLSVGNGINIGGNVIPVSDRDSDLGSEEKRWWYIHTFGLRTSRLFVNYSNNSDSPQTSDLTLQECNLSTYCGYKSGTTTECEQYAFHSKTEGQRDYGNYRAVYGECTGTGWENYGVYGYAHTSKTNYGVYGKADGGSTNWAGYFEGNVKVTGTINGTTVGSSDSRLKKDVQQLTGALDKVLNLRGVTYYWKNREEMAEAKGVSADKLDYGYDDKKHIGVIAQELEAEYPELIHTDGDGFKSVEYSTLTPILIEAVKELKAEKDELQTTVTTQQAKIDNQQQQIDELKRMVEELLKKQ
ncbi:MAG: tail fiber domain-containing protein, partial [Salinivirgaceae bacterium]|nr:tail fiber domain-containing protein [Salinivirgaceae bacterium]